METLCRTCSTALDTLGRCPNCGTVTDRPEPPPTAHRPVGSETVSPEVAQPDGDEHLGWLLSQIARQSHFEERYLVLGELARGGMGCVYEAFDRILRRQVAVKMVRPDHPHATATAVRGQFLKEARVSGRLLHPHILSVFDLGVSRDGRLYYTMRLVQGASLDNCLKALSTAVDTNMVRYPLRKLVAAFAGVCRGIDYAHQFSILHLDLKPANILMSGFQEVFVIDWGLARVDDVDDTDQLIDLYRHVSKKPDQTGDMLTHAGVQNRLVGTPGYMAPEQAAGDAKSFGPTTDVFGLGGLLYFILYGMPPNRGITPDDMIRASHVAKARSRLRHGILPRGQRVPIDHQDAVSALEEIALKALQIDPALRYRSADELVVELEEWLASAPV